MELIDKVYGALLIIAVMVVLWAVFDFRNRTYAPECVLIVVLLVRPFWQIYGLPSHRRSQHRYWLP